MLIWAIGLITLALILFIIELFIPSGGLIGFVATLSMVAGLICLFWVSQTAGMIATIIVLIAAPFAIFGGLKMFPYTPVGRWLTMAEEQKAGVTRYDPARDQDADKLVGHAGTALTDLRPIGMCRIDDKRMECLAESDVILAGAKVKVVAVNGMEIKVRQA